MTLISDTGTLRAFCEKVSASSEFVTVDTEFIREKTYWAELCLIQIAGADDAAAIDALAEGIDLSPVYELMRNRGIVKVFHAARQDFEIFYQQMGEVPHPVFDTQISAMVCGFGDSVGYEALVGSLARQRIDKSMRYTDWRRRPLSDKQLSYALSDVTHLRVVYEKLREMLDDNGREEWVAEEMATLTDPATYEPDPDNAWRRLKIRSPRPRFLLILKEVAAWREREAQRRNVPRNRVVRDDALLEIAAQAPRDRDALQSLRGMRGGQANGRNGEGLLEAIKRGREAPQDTAPALPARTQKQSRKEAARELIKVLLKHCAEKHGVAQKLIANADEIETLIENPKSEIRPLTGWRRGVFGEHAVAILEGRLALTANGSNIRLVEPGDAV